MTNPIVHFEIMGRDGPELVEFYRSLFQWPLQASDSITGYQHFAYLPNPEQGIGGGIGAADGEPYLTVYAEVDDIQRTWDRALELGAEPVLPPTVLPEIQGLIVARLRDLEGNVIGLSQRPAA
jgi:predicted enzyme related to lactoylglutathione lyase